MTTGEIVSAVIAFFTALGGILLVSAFARGKQSATLKHVVETVNKHTLDLQYVGEEMKAMRDVQNKQEGLINSITKDHLAMGGSIIKLENTLNRTNEELVQVGKSNAGLNATIRGFQELLNKIISGDLIIKPRS